MKKKILLFLTVCFGLISGIVPCASAIDSSEGFAFKDKVVLAYYRGTFEAAMSSNPDWLHISTFNELAEFSHIEATFEHGYKYIDLTAEFVRKFKAQK
jgi:hypothetical protein